MHKTLVQSSFLIFMLAVCQCHSAWTADPLPSWNDMGSKQAIVAFVERVTTVGSPGYVPIKERIATFDNDGCLWSEKPVYFQLFFAIDRVKELAPAHPEWKIEQPFKAVLENDLESLASAGQAGLMKLVMTTHAGMTTEEFSAVVKDWLRTAEHPQLKRPYTQLVYQPMLELLEYLRDNDFQTFIVSGGGIEFLRVFSEEVYGIPASQVVGSSIVTEYQLREGKPVLVRLPEIAFIDDKEGKPVAINQHIGQRPIFAAGNSDGDFQMLQWTTSGDGSRFAMLVHHDDQVREWAYDRDSVVGKLDRGLDEAVGLGWRLVSMKKDWKVIHPQP
ncbi:HAD family hydrolase [Planctomycetaceae bacterium SH139]